MLRSFIQRIGQRNPDCVFEKIDPRCKFLVLVLIVVAATIGNVASVSVLFIASGLLALRAGLLKIFLLSTLFAVVAWGLLYLRVKNLTSWKCS